MREVATFARLSTGETRRAFYKAIRLIKFSDVNAGTGLIVHHEGVPIYTSPQVLRWFGCICIEQFEELLRSRWQQPEMLPIRINIQNRTTRPYRAILTDRLCQYNIDLTIHAQRVTHESRTIGVALLKLRNVEEVEAKIEERACG